MTINILGIKIYIRKEYLAIGLIFLVIVAAAIGYKIHKGNGWMVIKTGSRGQVKVDTGDNSQNDEKKESSIDDEKDEIHIHVVGCVNNPGVVTLQRGSIIMDAIDAAGGATQEADMENINLVYKLNYNQQVRVLSKEEASGVLTSGDAGAGVAIQEDSGGAVPEVEPSDNKININTASKEQLERLPGIGEKRAEEIIIYRDKNGGFKKVEDIMKVSGIGEVYYENMKELITVE